MATQISLSQIDSLSLSFYPLQNGNYWEYKQVFFMWDNPPIAVSDTAYFSMEIIGDTTMQNFKSYKILKRTKLDTSHFTFEGLLFERVDTNTCNVYTYADYTPNSEYLIDSLKSLTNDSSRSSRDIQMGYRESVITVCTDISEIFVFDELKYTKHFEADVLYPFEYTLLEDIGLFSYHDSFDWGWRTLELQYAEINGIRYGIKVDYIDNSSIRNNIIGTFLDDNYPNPFNNQTTIHFYLDQPSNIQINLYAITGEKLFSVFKGYKSSGSHTVRLNGEPLASGIYIYTLESDHYRASKKCLLIK